MKYLIDTHTFLWCFSGSDRLGEKAKGIIRNTNAQRYISAASVWEFSIKYGMEKLRFEGGLPRLLEIIERHGIIILPIAMSYIAAVIELPFIHRDTFDRILVATAKTESLTILTADKNIPLYNVLCEW